MNYPQPLESCYFHKLFEGKISNRIGGWRDKRRPGVGKGVLLGHPGLKREPHVDNRGKNTRDRREARNDRASGGKSSEDDPSRDESKSKDEGRDHQLLER